MNAVPSAFVVGQLKRFYVSGESPPLRTAQPDFAPGTRLKPRLDTISMSFCGSPPRAWGQSTYGTDRYVDSDGSPPRAWGQSPHVTLQAAIASVHPHVRGDNATAMADAPCDCRFTPTCVGTIRCMAHRCVRYYGSPPRAWGQYRPSRLH